MGSTERIFSLVLTGGPCAGKSSAALRVREKGRERGWTVFFVTETATQLIEAGVTKAVCASAETFQRCVFAMQLAREEQYLAMARAVPARRVLVVFDRGLLDGAAYVGKEAFEGLLEGAGIARDEALGRYDAVVHLESAAKGGGANYLTSNNAARTETACEAAAADDAVLRAWEGHPCRRLVRSRDTFEEKMDELAAVLDGLLGPVEVA